MVGGDKHKAALGHLCEHKVEGWLVTSSDIWLGGSGCESAAYVPCTPFSLRLLEV